jgi:hypothetical protein
MPLLMRLGTTDWRVAQEILIYGEYEFISKLELPERPNVIDLGANIGVFLHFAARRWPHLLADLERNGRPFDVLGQSRGKATYLLRPRTSN